jgi:hypothetical protein
MPLRPNLTVTGLVTVSPSVGEMMYTSASFGAGVRAKTDPAHIIAKPTTVTADLNSFMVFSCYWLCEKGN